MVRVEDGIRLADVLDRIPGVTPDAWPAGRVFVDGRRATASLGHVKPGQRVEVFPPRSTTADLTVLGERSGIIAVGKPPGIPTEPDRHGSRESLLAQLASTIGVRAATLHALTRLDWGVSGIVLVARDRAARCLATAARTAGRTAHRYVAIATRPPVPSRGVWTRSIDDRRKRGGSAGAPRHATTCYACTAELDASGAALSLLAPEARPAWLVLEPRTGRTHQLRLHASAAGVPLVGDRAHGGPCRVRAADGSVRSVRRIALHAGWVRLDLGRGIWEVEAPLPRDLVQLWQDLGGRAEHLADSIREPLS
jgi:23S rRNA-/tRNA-specific pseudouridylate synthase